jgi:hypothetical protein
MRLALTMPFLALTLAPCFAQSDDFNPYQAILDGMPVAEAEPLIEAAHGPIKHRLAGIGKPYEGGPVLIIGAGPDEHFGVFVFCHDKLAAFGAPITPGVAGKILNPLNPTIESAFHADDDGITIFAEDDELIIGYRGVGTKNSWIDATYPATPMHVYNFTDYCASKSD